MFNIDKNIPLPTETQDAEKYPFDQMEIGDSFVASANIAHEHVKELEDIMSKVDKRNEAGDGRFFIYCGVNDDQTGRSIMRVWRVSFADYIDRMAPDDAPVIECMLNLLKNGPLSHTELTRNELAVTPGSLTDRIRILKKYAFLFKKSMGATNGFIYEIA